MLKFSTQLYFLPNRLYITRLDISCRRKSGGTRVLAARGVEMEEQGDRGEAVGVADDSLNELFSVLRIQR